MRLSIILKVAILCLVPQVSFSQTTVVNQKMPEVEIFNRCYMKMLQSVVPRTASLGKTLLDRVAANQMTGSAACTALFKQVRFTDNGVVIPAASSTLPQLTDQENQAMIMNFHNFHSTWFTVRNLDFQDSAMDSSTLLMRDNDEPPLYLTRALFGNNVPASSVFTATKGLKSVRQVPGGNTTNWQAKTLTAQNEALINGSASFVLSYGTAFTTPQVLAAINITDAQLTSFGKLVGVSEISEPLVVPLINLTSTSTNRPTAAQRTEMQNAIATAKANVNINEHLGGGILGSQLFILKNSNLTFEAAGGTSNDKEAVVARRVSRRVFEDLLCQQMPTLAEEDVVGEIVANSPHGFRQSTSCMACHTSLDPMAYTFRNFVAYRTADNSNNAPMNAVGTPINGVTRLPATAGSTVFALQPAAGELNYRDHANNLIKKPVSSVAELGLELSKSDDYYRCIAKRYYEFFTGYDVNLAPRNISAAQNTAQAQFHRNKVYALAASLKASQKISQLVQEIFSSEAFTYRNYVAP